MPLRQGAGHAGPDQHHHRNAQDTRPYAPVAFTFLLSTWALVRALDRPTAGRLAVYALLATLTVFLLGESLARSDADVRTWLRTFRIERTYRWVTSNSRSCGRRDDSSRTGPGAPSGSVARNRPRDLAGGPSIQGGPDVVGLAGD